MMTSRAFAPVALAALALAACERTVTNTVEVQPQPSTYLVEYLPGARPAAVGKTRFQLRVRKRADFTDATGLALTLAPVMTMPTMSHGAPVDVVTESSVPGTYDCAVYYQMASGPTMGYWTLTASVAGEDATFYPDVAMSMGSDTVRQNLWGASDVVTTSNIDKYVLFVDGAVTTGSLPLFVAHSEQMMMTFKRVAQGAVLSSPTGTVTSVALSVSDDATFPAARTVVATSLGDGHYALDLSTLGLSAGAQATVYVRLSVNGEAKTLDGAAVGASNGYATFKLTPGAGM